MRNKNVLPAEGLPLSVTSLDTTVARASAAPLLEVRDLSVRGVAFEEEGLRVLVHGPRHDPTRVSTADIFQALALPPVLEVLDYCEAQGFDEIVAGADPVAERVEKVRRISGRRT